MTITPKYLRDLATDWAEEEVFMADVETILRDAADEIERLRAALARYRAAENRLDVHLDGQTLLDEEEGE